ncbi:unnamed protein product [Dicrocoelium dendriticum]|nr:unnamed protein product [Dicrocoelium dendriticum]
MGVHHKSKSAVPFMIRYLLNAGQGAFRRAVGAGLSDYKKLASPEKGRQDLNLRCCQTVRLGVVSPPAAHRPAPKRPSSHEENDHGPTEKRPWSPGEAILVPRRSDPRLAEKRSSSRREATSVRVRVLGKILPVSQSIEGEGWGM